MSVRHALFAWLTSLSGKRRVSLPEDENVTAVDRQMMERALTLAQEAADRGEVPVGAVVYRDDVVLAEASNNRESSGDPTGHAEIVALREAGLKNGGWRLQDCSVAVTLEPCPMCAGAMVNARVGRLIYGAADPKGGACESLYEITCDPRLNHRLETIGGVMEERCGALLRTFFKERRALKKAARSKIQEQTS